MAKRTPDDSCGCWLGLDWNGRTDCLVIPMHYVEEGRSGVHFIVGATSSTGSDRSASKEDTQQAGRSLIQSNPMIDGIKNRYMFRDFKEPKCDFVVFGGRCLYSHTYIRNPTEKKKENCSSNYRRFDSYIYCWCMCYI
mmetsp:Transcript_12644/g.26645  ORF Transcript_12644/g.26645 Transcript_12644/m.26645 type:complete len:138 (+) Transcript_12644:863-1276(+)